jgi:hypothetical protein
MWLISIEDHHLYEFITLQKQMEANLHEITAMRESVSKARNSKVNKTLKSDTAREHPNQVNEESILTHIMLPTTRVMGKQPVNSESIPSKIMKRRAIHKSMVQSGEDIRNQHEDRTT